MANINSNSQRQPGYCRFKIGALNAISLHDGINILERAQNLVSNVPERDVTEAFLAIGVPEGKLIASYSALAIETDGKITLIDTGNGPHRSHTSGRLIANLEAAGYSASDVETILISHFHGDHISGLIDLNEQLSFPNAQVFVPQEEWDYWMDIQNRRNSSDSLRKNFDNCQRIFGIVGHNVVKFAWGQRIGSEFTALQADGHTPGHTVFEIESEAVKMMYVADLTNNPLVFAKHPNWQGRFDMLPERAVESRKRILDRAVEERLRLFFCHAPFRVKWLSIAKWQRIQLRACALGN
ncbi:MBL fold metallo-hydrolase [Ochrobactrum teleogrylli]